MESNLFQSMSLDNSPPQPHQLSKQSPSVLTYVEPVCSETLSNQQSTSAATLLDQLDCSLDYDKPSSYLDSEATRQFNLYRYYLSQYPELFVSCDSATTATTATITATGQSNSVDQNTNESRSMLVATKADVHYPSAELTSSGPIVSSGHDSTYRSGYQIEYNHKPTDILLTTSTDYWNTGKIDKMFRRSNTDSAYSRHHSSKRGLLCRCSKCCHSDSSVWSLSEPDLSQMTKDHDCKQQPQLANAHLTVTNDDRYAHLSRVITPPNAFLNVSQRQKSANSEFPKEMDCLCHLSKRSPITNTSHYHPQQQQQQNGHTKSVLYSNKVTQTDTDFRKVCGNHRSHKRSSTSTTACTNKLSKQLQRQLSLVEPSLTDTQRCTPFDLSRLSIDSDHIYHTILERNQHNDKGLIDGEKMKAWNQFMKLNNHNNNNNQHNHHQHHNISSTNNSTNNQRELGASRSYWGKSTNKVYSVDDELSSLVATTVNEHNDRALKSDNNNHSCSGSSGQQSQLAPPLSTYGVDHPLDVDQFMWHESQQQQQQHPPPPQHRIATSNNGIPCTCNGCRESRGLNLTTELLPLESQIPLQTMDNMDSLFQDSSMTELICTIL